MLAFNYVIVTPFIISRTNNIKSSSQSQQKPRNNGTAILDGAQRSYIVLVATLPWRYY